MLTAARFGTSDLGRATAFYDAITDCIGGRRVLERAEVVGYQGAEGGMLLIGRPFAGEPAAGNGNQVALAAPSRAAVNALYAKALEMGGRCEGSPGIRGNDPNGFYAAYFRDPDGNKLVVFRVGPPDARIDPTP